MRAATGKHGGLAVLPASRIAARAMTCHFAVLMNHESLDEFSSMRRILPCPSVLLSIDKSHA